MPRTFRNQSAKWLSLSSSVRFPCSKSLPSLQQEFLGDVLMKLVAAVIRLFARTFLQRNVRNLDSALERRIAKAKPQFQRHIPEKLLTMLVIAEDHRFFSHGGFDPIAFLRAAYRTAVFRDIQGGSTIEQQLVRVVTGRYERTLRRKFIEICLATTIVRHLTKRNTAVLYLTIAYYGWRMTDLSRAIKLRGLDLDDLSDDDASTLVALIKYPVPKSPEKLDRHQLKLTARVLHIRSHYDAAGRPELFAKQEDR